MAHGIHQFANAHRRVCAENRTGNLSSEDINSLTMATRVSADLYMGVLADREQDVNEGRIRKRRARVVHFEFVDAWRKLRHLDQICGAAAADAERAAAQRETSGSRKDATYDAEAVYQPAPVGVKRAKLERAREMAVERERKSAAAALSNSATAAKARTGIAYYMHPTMTNTREARTFRCMQNQYHLGSD